MARKFDSAGDSVTSGGSYGVASGDYTLFCWARADHAPGNPAGSDALMGYSATGGGHYLDWDSPNTAYHKAIQHEGSDSSWQKAQLTSTLSADTWYAFAGTYNAATQDLKVWLNGVNEATTSGVPANSANSGVFYPMFNSNNVGTIVAWACRWSVVLTANEMLALAGGVNPRTIRPESLTHCYPLWGLHSPEIDLSANSDTATVTGTSVTNGPPVTLFMRAIPSYSEELSLDRAPSSTVAFKGRASDAKSRVRGLDAYALLRYAEILPQIYTRTLSDSVSTSDAAARAARAFRQMPQDAIALLDLVTRGQTHGRTASDSLSILDALVTGRVRGRTTQDNAALTDALFAQYKLTRGTTDTASVTDDLKTQANRLRIATDTTDITDTVQRRADLFRRLLDEATVTDSLASTITAAAGLISRLLHDDISTEDAIQRTVKALRLTHDELATTDSLRRSAAMFRFSTDGLSTNDALQATMRALRVIPETVEIGDALQRSAKLIRQLLDTLGITDTLTSTITLPGSLVISRILQDGINVEDLVKRSMKAYRIAHDDTTAGDQTARRVQMTRTMTDVLTVAEAMARFLIATRITTDPIEASDTAIRYALLNRLTSDAATAEDSLGISIEYFQELIGYVLMSLRNAPIVLALDKSTAKVDFARSEAVKLLLEDDNRAQISYAIAQPILMEMRNL